MSLRGPATRLTVLVKESEQWHHRPLYTEVVHRAHAAGLAGASVFRGIEGFGANSVIHRPHLFRLSDDLPVLVVIVDVAERVHQFLAELEELDINGLVTLDEVTRVRGFAVP